jgi:hypothetical protein
MNTITTHAAELAPRDKSSRPLARLLNRISALAYAAAERLTSPQRDVPPEYYRFPPF